MEACAHSSPSLMGGLMLTLMNLFGNFMKIFAKNRDGEIEIVEVTTETGLLVLFCDGKMSLLKCSGHQRC